jgi:WD40 repeat protein
MEFAPFVKHRTLTGHFDTVTSIEWSSDSRFFLSASRDLTARMWSLDPEDGFVPTTIGGHKQAVLGAWFSKDQETVGMGPGIQAQSGKLTSAPGLHSQQRRSALRMEVHGAVSYAGQ